MFTNISSGELLRSLFAFLCAAAVALCATPLVKKFACRVGAIDVPKDARRIHKKPIPLLGGIAIYLGFLTAVLIFADLSLQLWGILAGASIIVLLGALDDRFVLDAKLKFVVQIVAAIIPVACGLRSSPTSSISAKAAVSGSLISQRLSRCCGLSAFPMPSTLSTDWTGSPAGYPPSPLSPSS